MKTHDSILAEIKSWLLRLPIGRTTAIRNTVVTRWNHDVFEVGVWGRKSITAEQAARKITENYL